MRLLAAILLLVSSTVLAGDWYPVNVNLWTPPFNDRLERMPGEYVPLGEAQKKWRICVSIPNLKDAAWKAISYGIITEHGATISVESEKGIGTTFTVRFPVTSDEAQVAIAERIN